MDDYSIYDMRLCRPSATPCLMIDVYSNKRMTLGGAMVLHAKMLSDFGTSRVWVAFFHPKPEKDREAGLYVGADYLGPRKSSPYITCVDQCQLLEKKAE